MTLVQNISTWDTVDFESDTEKSFATFPCDPLAYVCSLLRAGKAPWEFNYFIDLKQFPENIEINDEDYRLGTEIRKHFQNKYLLWLLKNQGAKPSAYRKNLYDLLQSGNDVNREHFRILATLPQFYEEDKLTEKLFKDYNSLSNTYREGEPVSIDAEFEYAGRIQRNSSKSKLTRYYFKNRKNQLLLKEIPNNECGKNLMDYLVEGNQPLKILGQAVARKQKGFDFRLYYLNNFELLR